MRLLICFPVAALLLTCHTERAAELAEEAWLERAQRAIAAREYEASHSERGLQAPNRAHGLRTYFAPNGIRVHDRVGGEHLFGLELAALGRGESLAPVGRGEVTHERGRVEIRRGGLVEWYENSADGLEQGFTLGERPPGDAELVLELALDGARAVPAGHGALQFVTSTGRWLRYDKLVALDSLGRSVPARLELAGASRVRLLVEDRGASYPLVIDPLVTGTVDNLVFSGQGNSSFATALSPAGDLNGDGYDDVLVGARDYDAGQQDEGAVFVYLGSPLGIATGGPSFASILQGNQPNADFGVAVSGAGDVNGDGYDDIAVGCLACALTSNPTFLGGVFVYHGGPLGIGTHAVPATVLDARDPPGTGFSNGLGRLVDAAGDVNGDGYDDLLVSASVNADATLIYYGGPAGIPSGGQSVAGTRLTSAGALFGSVAGIGDVNADGYDDVAIGLRSLSGSQAATIHLGGPAGLASGVAAAVATSVLSPLGNDIASSRPPSVSRAGDLNGDGFADLIATGFTTTTVSLFQFLGSASGIAGGAPPPGSQVMNNLPHSGSANVPHAVAAGDVNGDGYADALFSPNPLVGGTLTMLLGSSGGLQASSFYFLGSPIFSPSFAVTALGAGDVNGDGYDDVVVGSPGTTIFTDAEGVAYVYFGSSMLMRDLGASAAPSRVVMSQPNALTGVSVANAGDVNGDGFDDRIVGSPSFDNFGQPDGGAAFVFLGASSLNAVDDLSTVNLQMRPEGQANSSFGSSVAGAGDVNADGFADVIVGARFWSNGQANEGAAFVFFGSPAGVLNGSAEDAQSRIESNRAGATLGDVVAGAGDVNGDGYSDLLVVASGWSNGESGEGALFVLHGGRGGVFGGGIGVRIPETANGVIEGGQVGATLNFAAPAGDVNGDGYGDVIAAAIFYDNPELDEGGAFVFHGGPNGIGKRTLAQAETRIECNRADAWFGFGTSAGGDVNGDGFADVVVPWGSAFQGQPNPGGLYLLLGQPAGIAHANLQSLSPIFTGSGPGGFGLAMARAGDVNADGFGDIAMGSTARTFDLIGEGGVLVLYGNALGAPVLSPFPQINLPPVTNLQGDETGANFGTAVSSAGDANGDGFSDLLVGAPFSNQNVADEGSAFVFIGNLRGKPVRTRQRRTDVVSPVVVPGGTGTSLDSFGADFFAAAAKGRRRLAGEFEACALGTPFGAPSCVTEVTPFSPPGGASIQQLATFTGLTPNTRYRWRARTLYTDDTGPLPVAASRGPWKRVQPSLAGYDIRTARDSDGDGLTDLLDNCPYVPNPGQEDDGGIGLSAPDDIGNACQCGNVAGNGRLEGDDVAALRAALANPAGAGLTLAQQQRCAVFGPVAPCSVLQVTVLRRALATPSLLPITSTPPAQICTAAVPL